jgi:hypothetical protein
MGRKALKSLQRQLLQYENIKKSIWQDYFTILHFTILQFDSSSDYHPNPAGYQVIPTGC